MAAKLIARKAVPPAWSADKGAGDQLLAGAAFAEDQHGDILGCDAADRLVHLLHLRATADENVRRGVGQFRPPRRRPERASAGSICVLCRSVPQFRQFQRLEQVFDTPPLIASMAKSVVPWPVMRMTGVRASCRRTFSNVSKPVASPRWTSRMTTSGRERINAARPSAAEEAVTRLNSGSRNARRNAWRIEGSSSISSSVGIKDDPRMNTDRKTRMNADQRGEVSRLEI